MDAVQFIAVIAAIRFAVFYICTKAFILMIPDGDACPLCDGGTLPIERNGWWRVLGAQFRRSWCLDCGWEGVLRRSDLATFFTYPRAIAKSESHSGQLPLNSKKSSK